MLDKLGILVVEQGTNISVQLFDDQEKAKSMVSNIGDNKMIGDPSRMTLIGVDWADGESKTGVLVVRNFTGEVVMGKTEWEIGGEDENSEQV